MTGKIHIKKRQRGQSVTLNFIAISDKFGEDAEQESADINIKDLAWLRFGFSFPKQNNEYVLQSSVSFRRHGNANSTSVVIKLSCGEFKHEHENTSPYNWIEVKMNPKQHDSFIDGVIVASLEVTVIALNLTRASPINKLFEETEFTDFQLCAADGSVAVHKSLLSVFSDMFKTMLGGEWKETSEGRIKMPGVTAQTLQHLKEYMYLDTLPDEGLESLLLLATHYLMDTLKADCIEQLVERVRPEDVHGLIKFACENNLTDLIKKILHETESTIVNDMYHTIYK